MYSSCIKCIRVSLSPGVEVAAVVPEKDVRTMDPNEIEDMAGGIQVNDATIEGPTTLWLNIYDT